MSVAVPTIRVALGCLVLVGLLHCPVVCVPIFDARRALVCDSNGTSMCVPIEGDFEAVKHIESAPGPFKLICSLNRPFPCYPLALDANSGLTYRLLYSVDSRAKLDTILSSCTEKLHVLAVLSSISWSVIGAWPPTGNSTSPPFDPTWVTNSSQHIEVGFAWPRTSSRLNLTFLGTWSSQTVSEYRDCVPGAYCCQDDNGFSKSFLLTPNTNLPSYHVFRMNELANLWENWVNVTLNGVSTLLHLNNDVPRLDWPASGAPPILTARTIPLSTPYASILGSLSTSFYLAVDPTWSRQPFLVPIWQFLDQNNRIGLTQSGFVNVMDGICDLSSAQILVSVGHTATEDSFSTWFDASILLYFYDGWVSIPESRLDPMQNPPHYLIVQPNTGFSLFAEVILNSTYNVLNALAATPIGVGGGMYLLSETQLVMYLDVLNQGGVPGVVYADNVECCYALASSSNQALSCSVLFDITGSFHTRQFVAPGETARFLYTTLNIPFGQSGYCNLSLQSSYSSVVYYQVGFELGTAASEFAKIPSLTQPCTSPSISLPDLPFCQLPCTLDQVYNVSTSICDPLNCNAKYGSSRNQYDSATGICLPSTTQTPPVASPLAPQNISMPTYPVDNGTVAFQLTPDGNYTVNCGIHGTPNADLTSCTCESGWLTDESQPISSFTFCSLQDLMSAANTNKAPTQRSEYSPFNSVVGFIIAFCIILLCSLIVASIVHSMHKGERSDRSAIDAPQTLGTT